MEPEHHQDIEWVEWYKGSVSNSNRMRRETQYPYEWDSRNGNDSKMRNWSEGRHKVIIWVKKRCRTEPFKYECWIHFDRHNNNNPCRNHAFFKDPRNNSTFLPGDHVLCVVEAERHQDIEYMELYLNNRFIRRESQAPYEWNKFNGQRNPEFRNHLKSGTNTLKCKYKTRCGTWHEIIRTFTIRSN